MKSGRNPVAQRMAAVSLLTTMQESYAGINRARRGLQWPDRGACDSRARNQGRHCMRSPCLGAASGSFTRTGFRGALGMAPDGGALLATLFERNDGRGRYGQFPSHWAEGQITNDLSDYSTNWTAPDGRAQSPQDGRGVEHLGYCGGDSSRLEQITSGTPRCLKLLKRTMASC